MTPETDKLDSSDQRWRKLVHQLGIGVENAADFVRERFRRRLMHGQSLKIIAYHGMGNNHHCQLRGRVLEYQNEPSDDVDSIWKNLQDSYRRFETDEVPDVAVCLEIDGQQHRTTTDEEGYFFFEVACTGSAEAGQLKVELGLPDHPDQHEKVTGIVFVPAATAPFGVISDIDDTVLLTQATSIVKMMRLTLLESSSTRIPFAGVAAFYNAMRSRGSPFFYVSSSPWNLFDFLDDFMRLNKVPAGPLFLRDFGIDKTKLVAGPHKTHKLAQIRTVLAFYPEMPFILIGDSGQHDPEIYAQIVSEFPGRILSIYIRDVADEARDRQVQALAMQLRNESVDLLLVPDSLAAATHAASSGYIESVAVASIEEAVRKSVMTS